MRKLRNSALAIATATTVALGGMTVAGAQDGGALPNEESNVNLSETGSSAGSLGDALEFGEEADPRAIFGSYKSGFGDQPLWAQLMYGVGVQAWPPPSSAWSLLQQPTSSTPTSSLSLSLIHISEPTRRLRGSRMPSSA